VAWVSRQLAGLRRTLGRYGCRIRRPFRPLSLAHQQLIAEGDKLGVELESCRLAIGALESNSSYLARSTCQATAGIAKNSGMPSEKSGSTAVKGERQEGEIYESAVSSADSVADRLVKKPTGWSKNAAWN